MTKDGYHWHAARSVRAWRLLERVTKRRTCWNCHVFLAFGVGVCCDCARALVVGALSIAFAWAWSKL